MKVKPEIILLIGGIFVAFVVLHALFVDSSTPKRNLTIKLYPQNATIVQGESIKVEYILFNHGDEEVFGTLTLDAGVHFEDKGSGDSFIIPAKHNKVGSFREVTATGYGKDGINVYICPDTNKYHFTAQSAHYNDCLWEGIPVEILPNPVIILENLASEGYNCTQVFYRDNMEAITMTNHAHDINGVFYYSRFGSNDTWFCLKEEKP